MRSQRVKRRHLREPVGYAAQYLAALKLLEEQSKSTSCNPLSFPALILHIHRDITLF